MMKTKFSLSIGLMLVFVATACTAPASPAATVTPLPAPTRTGTPTPTLVPTDTPVPTETPTIAVTPSPAATLENSVLAESGYDIADVRLSFPREDMVVIGFKYRFDESRKSKDTYIYMSVPPDCMDDDNKNSPPSHVGRHLTGVAAFQLKLTLEGDCTADAIEFRFYPDPNRNQTPLFREYVLQSYRLVRSFPTVNSDTFRIGNLKFTSQAQWNGTLTFDYAVSEEIPFPLEQYSISVYAFGADGSCFMAAMGPVLATHTGAYRVDMNLPRDLSNMNRKCVDGRDHYTYTTTYLAVHDDIAGRMVYHQALNMPFTFIK